MWCLAIAASIRASSARNNAAASCAPDPAALPAAGVRRIAAWVGAGSADVAAAVSTALAPVRRRFRRESRIPAAAAAYTTTPLSATESSADAYPQWIGTSDGAAGYHTAAAGAATRSLAGGVGGDHR